MAKYVKKYFIFFSHIFPTPIYQSTLIMMNCDLSDELLSILIRALMRSSFLWGTLTRRSFPKSWAALMQALILRSWAALKREPLTKGLFVNLKCDDERWLTSAELHFNWWLLLPKDFFHLLKSRLLFLKEIWDLLYLHWSTSLRMRKMGHNCTKLHKPFE